MNGWDALKTGRRVRRRCAGGFSTFSYVAFQDGMCSGREEMNADDWEVEPRSVEVTREKLAEAWNEHTALVTPGKAPSSGAFNNFCRALGLEP